MRPLAIPQSVREGDALPPIAVHLESRWYAAPLLIFAVTRVALFILTFASTIMLPLNPLADAGRTLPTQLFFDGWFRWDGLRYVTLASEGYWLSPDGAFGAPALLPLYPAMSWLLGQIIGVPMASLLVANAAFAGAMVAVYRLLVDRMEISSARLSLLLIAVFPYSFVFAGPYPHSLVLLFAALAFLAFERGKYAAAWLCAALAALTAPPGLAVILALAVGLASRSKLWSVVMLAAAVPVILFAAYLTLYVGHPTVQVLAAVLGTSSPSPLSTLWGNGGLPGVGARGGLAIGVGVAAAWFVAIGLCFQSKSVLGFGATVYGLTLCALALLVDPMAMGPWLALVFPAFALAPRYLKGEVRTMTCLTAATMTLALLTMAHSGWYNVDAAMEAPTHPRALPRIIAHLEVAGLLPSREFGMVAEDDLFVLGYDLDKDNYQPGENARISVSVMHLKDAQRNYLLTAHLVDRDWRRYGEMQVSLPKVPPSPGLGGELGLARYDLVLPIDTQIPSGVYALELDLLVVPPYSTVYEHPALIDLAGTKQERLTIAEVIVAREGELLQRGQERPATRMQASVGDSIELLGFETRWGAEKGRLEVSLYWAARGRPTANYTVFVQLLDAEGRLLAQDDGYPMAGRFPTTQLEPGSVVKDTHVLQVPSQTASGGYRLIAGMYDLATMQRLPAVLAPGAAAGDHLPLGIVEALR